MKVIATRFRRTWFCVFLCLYGRLSAQALDPLLINPSFEFFESNIAPWDSNADVLLKESTHQIDIFGHRHLQVTNSKGKYLRQTFYDLDQNGFILSLWMKSPSGSASVQVSLITESWDKSGSKVDRKTFTLSKDWSHYSLETFQPNAWKIRVELLFDSNATYHLDNFTLKPNHSYFDSVSIPIRAVDPVKKFNPSLKASNIPYDPSLYQIEPDTRWFPAKRTYFADFFHPVGNQRACGILQINQLQSNSFTGEFTSTFSPTQWTTLLSGSTMHFEMNPAGGYTFSSSHPDRKNFEGKLFQFRQSFAGPVITGTFEDDYEGTPTECTFRLWMIPDLSYHPAITEPTPHVLPIEDTDDFDLRQWDAQDGLPINATRSISQTADGHIWVGTTAGLGRFDGTMWRMFTSDTFTNLQASNFRFLKTNSKGILISACAEGYIYEWNGNAPEVLVHKTELPGEEITGFDLADDDSLWFIVDGQFICRKHKSALLETTPLTSIDAITLNVGSYYALLPDYSGPVRLSDICYESQNNIFLSMNHLGIRQLNTQSLNSKLMNGVQGWNPIYYQHRGRFLIYSLNQGLGVYNVNTHELQCLSLGSPSKIGSVVMDHLDQIWVSRKNELLCKQSDQWLRYNLPYSTSIPEHLYCDRDGNLWFTLDGKGICQLRVKHRLEHPVSDRKFWSTTKLHDGTHAYSTSNSIILEKNGKIMETEWPPISTSPGPITSSKSEPGSIWIGLTPSFGKNLSHSTKQMKGIPILSKFDGSHFDIIPFQDSLDQPSVVHQIVETGESDVYLATDLGVYRYYDNQFQKLNWLTNHENCDVLSILTASDGSMWILVKDKGVLHINGKNTSTFRIKDGAITVGACFLSIDSHDNIWVTGGQGLTRISNGEVFQYYNELPFLNSLVMQVIEDNEGFYWFATTGGFYVIEKDNLLQKESREIRKFPYYYYGIRDGFDIFPTDTRFSSKGLQDEDGRFTFAMDNGVLQFDPKELLQQISPPEPKIVWIKGLNNTYYEEGFVDNTALQLPPDASKFLQIKFGAIEHRFPHTTRFQYRFSNKTDKWSDTNDQSALYFTDLSPGRHTFEVRAFDHNHATNGESASISFDLQPFYYQTWWFRTLTGFTFCSFIYLVHHRRIQNRIKIKDLERRLALKDERHRIAKDMHDEIGGGLAQIRMLGELSQDPERKPEDLKMLHTKAATVASESSQSLREIIFALNSNLDQYDDLVEHMRKQLHSILEESPIQLHYKALTSGGTHDYSPQEKRQLLYVTREILTNAIKHSNAKNLWVHLKQDTQTLRIETKDDGLGFNAEEAKNLGNGLQNIQDRIEAIGGKVRLSTRSGEGTQYTINILFQQTGRD